MIARDARDGARSCSPPTRVARASPTGSGSRSRSGLTSRRAACAGPICTCRAASCPIRNSCWCSVIRSSARRRARTRRRLVRARRARRRTVARLDLTARASYCTSRPREPVPARSLYRLSARRRLRGGVRGRRALRVSPSLLATRRLEAAPLFCAGVDRLSRVSHRPATRSAWGSTASARPVTSSQNSRFTSAARSTRSPSRAMRRARRSRDRSARLGRRLEREAAARSSTLRSCSRPSESSCRSRSPRSRAAAPSCAPGST